jgi:endonuclease G
VPLGAVVARSIHVALGVPTDSDASDDILIEHDSFVLSYNPHLREPNWVSWHVTAADLGLVKRQNRFHTDSLLPDIYAAVLPTDYRATGYDRGHMCPSADRTATIEENDETFVMTNMEPQLHRLNAGPWSQLEAFERHLVTADHKEVFIVAGGVFDSVPMTIGPGIAVPHANYKIIVVVEPGQGVDGVNDATVVYAAVMANAAAVSGTHWRQYLTTVDDIELQTGYDFLRDVPTSIQAVVESRRSGP